MQPPSGVGTSPGAPQDSEEAPIPRGARVGRNVVIDVVGGGGMGFVYSAFDPELDRRVALKLLRRVVAGPDAQARLLREAQAMARLSHPNVVTVFDAGEHQGRVFLAMEYVAGVTLRDWLREAPRTFKEKLAVLLLCPDGLFTEADDGAVRFVALPPPAPEDVARIAVSVARRVEKALDSAGLQDVEVPPEDEAEALRARALQQSLPFAQATALVLTAGELVRRLAAPRPPPSPRRPQQTKENIMPEYLCLQRNLPGAGPDGGKPSPAEMQGMYAKFNEWREKFQKNLTDMGGRLGTGRLVTSKPAPDGPLVEIKELVGGYMIVTAANIEEAIEVASGCPGLIRPDSGVEVIEIIMPG